MTLPSPFSGRLPVDHVNVIKSPFVVLSPAVVTLSAVTT